MNPVAINSFFSTTRSFSKYVISSNRELVQIPANEIALDYSPNSGKLLGILVEQESTNYFPDSEMLTTGVLRSANASVTTTSVAGSPRSVLLAGGSDESWVGANVSIIDPPRLGLSFYVKLSNNDRPVVGYWQDELADIVIRTNDTQINIADSVIDIQGPMNDNSYRVRLQIRNPVGGLSNIKIVKKAGITASMNVSRIQLEPQLWTSYLPTNGTPVSRLSETVYRDLTHGIDFNENQGTMDVVFSPTPGSTGSALSLLTNDWSNYVAAGHQYDEYGYGNILRFVSESNSLDRLVSYDVFNQIRSKYTAIRFSYSGYGVRGTLGNNNPIMRLKDFDSMQLGKFDRVQFGESYDGSFFTGHIHMFNVYARTFNNDEMQQNPYGVNASSLPTNYNLDA